MYEIVKIGNESFPIRYGMNSLRIFCNRTGMKLNDLQSLGSNISLEDACQLILAGVEDGSRKAGKDFTLTIDQLSDLLDDDFDALSRCMDIFSNMFTTESSGNLKAAQKQKRKK